MSYGLDELKWTSMTVFAQLVNVDSSGVIRSNVEVRFIETEGGEIQISEKVTVWQFPRHVATSLRKNFVNNSVGLFQNSDAKSV